MKILALDVGEKRIGVARADSGTRIAVPVGYIEVNGSEWQEIAKMARLNNTNFFVIGLPRSNEGNETKQSLYVRQFVKKLTEKVPEARVRLQDESLTSVLAEKRLKSRKKPYAKGDIDAEAACIILQDFLESYKEETIKRLAPADSSDFPSEPRGGSKIARVTTEMKTAVTEVRDNTANITKKGADKVRLNTRKAKHKMKTTTKWITGIMIVIILAIAATGVAMFIRDKRYKQYAEYFAEQEARNNEEAVFSFSISPGETIFDIKKHLIALGYTNGEVEEAFRADYDFGFLKERPAGATLEGYLYGETYEFYKDTSVKDILKAFLTKMGEVIASNRLEEKYAVHGLSLYEGITLASIVQKEAAAPDQPTVAQVFLTRLDAGMLLGSDVTVSYALDVLDPERKDHSDNQTALGVDSCYNTRLHAGLPCGPISNPSLSALLAVAEPADTSYLYFLTGDDGMMYYSYTEEEHIRNIYEHCQTLCDISL